MVRGFCWSRSSLEAECSHSGGNESADIISGALGMSLAGWQHSRHSILPSHRVYTRNRKRDEQGETWVILYVCTVQTTGNTELGL